MRKGREFGGGPSADLGDTRSIDEILSSIDSILADRVSPRLDPSPVDAALKALEELNQDIVSDPPTARPHQEDDGLDVEALTDALIADAHPRSRQWGDLDRLVDWWRALDASNRGARIPPAKAFQAAPPRQAEEASAAVGVPPPRHGVAAARPVAEEEVEEEAASEVDDDELAALAEADGADHDELDASEPIETPPPAVAEALDADTDASSEAEQPSLEPPAAAEVDASKAAAAPTSPLETGAAPAAGEAKTNIDPRSRPKASDSARVAKIQRKIEKVIADRLRKGLRSRNGAPPDPAVARRIGYGEEPSAPTPVGASRSVAEVSGGDVEIGAEIAKAQASLERDEVAPAIAALDALPDADAREAAAAPEAAPSSPAKAPPAEEAQPQAAEGLDALKPVLSEWLNENLESIVKRVLREEIDARRRDSRSAAEDPPESAA